MHFLKLFENYADYQTYIDGDNVALPNVSLCEDTGLVYSTPAPDNA